MKNYLVMKYHILVLSGLQCILLINMTHDVSFVANLLARYSSHLHENIGMKSDTSYVRGYLSNTCNSISQIKYQFTCGGITILW